MDAFRGNSLDAENAAQFGDFVGGYFGSITGLLSVILLIRTLRDQSSRYTDDGVEKRFFQLLDYHRQNVTEIGIGNRSGRRIFVTLVREFRDVLKIVKSVCKSTLPEASDQEIINISYMTFYYGIGKNSDRLLKSVLRKYKPEIIDKIASELKMHRENSDKNSKSDSGYIYTDADYNSTHRYVPREENRPPYLEYEGHQSRLAHYFRHFYHMIKYIDRNAKHRAMEYATIVRAQLTNHEQALLCVNSLSTIGAEWRKQRLIINFSLIKNLPEDFFDPAKEFNILDFYPESEVDYEYKHL